jgi:hypothetical protein
VGINDKCGGYLRLIPLVLLLVPPTLLLVPPGGTNVFQWEEIVPPRLKYGTVMRVDSADGNSIARKRSYVYRVVMRHNNI